MTTQTKPTGLTALRREFLDARARRLDAEGELRAAEGGLELMQARNADHRDELQRLARDGFPLVKSQWVLVHGTGGGHSVVYRRCRRQSGEHHRLLEIRTEEAGPGAEGETGECRRDGGGP